MIEARPASPRARLLWAAGITIASALFLALGTWQLYRMQWKQALIARVNARAHAAPAAAPGRAEWPSITAENAEYRHVQVAGTLLHDRSTLVQASTNYGLGFWVMTPLKTAAGDTILVNRGFIPTRQTPSAAPQAALVTGLLRISEPGGSVVRKNDAAGQRWYSRDVQAIAAAGGLTQVAPYFIDADAAPAQEAGQPIGGLTVIAFRDNHLVYALTWYALALMIIGRTWQITRKKRQTGVE
ncbi:SURF1 family protein [Pseudoduganella violaceinigra]|uniref:SURF1 family protein n=1 Tax=Pseudoduganella violaceinigra TaxID=246602 RepID=UPI0003FD79E0|nr:SURF1 family protein [Pseudoduganella violaceinigra]